MFKSQSKSHVTGGVLLAAAASLFAGVPAHAGVNADSVLDYQPGSAPAGFQTSSAATGAIQGDTGFGALDPFNPAFDPSQIVIVGAGGSLTLHLSGEVPANGQNLGVFANNGLVDVSADGSGAASKPAATFSAPSEALVSVSKDGQSYVPLNGGQPITFSNPANFYLDTSITNDFQPLGTQTANAFKPFLGGLSSFNGQTYDQIKTTLNGSAGGTWLDLRGSGLPSINYVKFTVPQSATYRMVLDSVSGMSAAKPIVAGQAVISESVGAGQYTSNVVVDFGPQSYDFQVHYNGSITGEQALQMLNDDSAFRLTVEHFSFGDFVTGLDYGGYVDVGDGSGGSGFWKYFTSTDGSTWNSATTGAGGRTLSDGAFDGWVWSQSGVAAPVVPLAVPEPSSLALLFLSSASLLVRRRRKLA